MAADLRYDRARLTRFAWLSIAGAIVTIALKSYAFLITNSIGLFSDAVESFVNLFVAILALAMLAIAAKPADEDHAYGHSKAEYFSSGVEGALILIAAASIALAGIRRLFAPIAIEQVGMGIAISLIAAMVNLIVALVLSRASKTYGSITLEANGQHLLADVWTSVGVLLGVSAVTVSGWQILDPLIALAVGGHIARTGIRIGRQSILGLMDTALPHRDVKRVKKILQPYMKGKVRYHALRTRRSGARRFVSLHVLVPGKWTVQKGHRLLENIEAEIRREIPGAIVFTHLESLEDASSWEDQSLDR